MKKHLLLWVSAAVSALPAAAEDLTDYVNPLQGANSVEEFSSGNTYPAITLPWGTHCWVAQTGRTGDGWQYDYNSPLIRGFKLTHQPSPWCNDYGCFSVMPVTGQAVFWDEESRASNFRRTSEQARPDCYGVTLEKYAIRAAIAPTMCGAAMEFTYPASENSSVVIDCLNKGGYVKVMPGQKSVAGWSGYYSGACGRRLPGNFAVYFVMTFSKPFTAFGTWSDGKPAKGSVERSGRTVGAWVSFPTDDSEQVTVKVAASFVSREQALTNMERELGGLSFEQVRKLANDEWNRQLGKVLIEGGTLEQKRTFYSALYHMLLFPRRFSEIDAAGGEVHYSPYTGKVCDGPFYADNGFWDTFRATHPLNTILYPELTERMMQGLVCHVKEGGWVPEWFSPLAFNCMIGQNSSSVIADAYLKGIRGYDMETLWLATLKGCSFDGEKKLGRTVGRKNFDWYNRLGYIPCDLHGDREATSRTMEYAYNDWCIAQLGQALGKPGSVVEQHLKRAGNYRNVFDPSDSFVKGRDRHGNWESDFRPDRWGSPFTEGSSWHWTWAVFHDPQGLIDLMGGDERFVAKLDEMFAAHPTFDPGSYREVIHEMTEMVAGNMGQYAHGNQPVQHAIYLYDYAGAPWKAQYWARRVMDRLYNSGWETGKGYCGDEDNGQTSAWYIFSAMGMYPVCPGSLEYPLGSPLFERTTIQLPGGKTFIIKAVNNASQNCYIQSASLNGQPFEQAYLTHGQIMAGGLVEYVMGPEPNRAWAAKTAMRPYSMSKRSGGQSDYGE